MVVPEEDGPGRAGAAEAAGATETTARTAAARAVWLPEAAGAAGGTLPLIAHALSFRGAMYGFCLYEVLGLAMTRE